MYRVIAIILLLISVSLCAQNSKKVQKLKAQQTQLEKNIKSKQREIETTQKEVKKGEARIHHIGLQLEDRIRHIHSLEEELEKLSNEIERIKDSINSLQIQLDEKKARFSRAVRMTRLYPKVKSPLLFVLSAKNVTQMYRRLRYTHEYASYQYTLGQQIQSKQAELEVLRNRLVDKRTQMHGVMSELVAERKKLAQEQLTKQKEVKNLRKKEKDLAIEVNKRKKELAALNKKIDNLIAYEIEQARKRAAEQAAKQAAKSRGTATQKSSSSSSTSSSKSSNWLTPEERKLSGNFEANRGRLPVPLTGQYRIAAHFGQYRVEGLSHVTLDNKGVNYAGKQGARARSVFDGVVTAVFAFGGTKNVLVRHGSYISVYCNLSSVIVAKGQKVKTCDILGTPATDDNGNTLLHFQLRKETAKLNPELWIGR